MSVDTLKSGMIFKRTTPAGVTFSREITEVRRIPGDARNSVIYFDEIRTFPSGFTSKHRDQSSKYANWSRWVKYAKRSVFA